MKAFWTKLVIFIKSFWKGIQNIATWVASVLEDQGTTGSISSKRVTLGVALYFLYQMVQGMLAGKVIDNSILWVVTSIILFCVGAITSEYFTMFGSNGFNKTNIPPKA